MQHNDFAYDIESYPNVFSAVFIHAASGTIWVFEVSDRKNQSVQFLAFLRAMSQGWSNRQVGFNNIGYDYPVIHHLMRFDSFTAADAYEKSISIINTPWGDRSRNVIWERDRKIPQVDLYKIHHFDNENRRTSLKQIEIAMRMDCVADLPYALGTWLTPEQIPALLGYNIHDAQATLDFYKRSLSALDFRAEMSADLGEDVTNQSDTNIGSKLFISEMEATTPGICGRPGRWRQTPRNYIALSECIFPYVRFEHANFNRIVEFFQPIKLRETKGAFEGYETFVYTNGDCVVVSKDDTPAVTAAKNAGARRVLSASNKGVVAAHAFGVDFVFGTGGIHGAISNKTWRATPRRVIQGRDVKSYYPNLAIKNRVFPEHLSGVFCDVYERLYQRRAATSKKDPRNGALKLALNGTYGNSNSRFSPFYDPKYTMTITINGQLLLCMLAEALAKIPTLELIQVNTDGVEYAVDAEYVSECDQVSAEWETLTALELEVEEYSLFAQRDVNNYLCIQTDGTVKCKGAFEWQHGTDSGGNWHKNQSCKIIAIAAEAALVHGTPVAETVNACDDPFRFMHTLKVQRTDRVMLGGDLTDYEDTASPPNAKGKHPSRKRHVGGVEQQRTGRYYIARDGQPLWKVMKPLARLPHHERPQAIEKGHMVAMCNDLHDFDWARLDRSYYTKKAQELVDSTGA